jgi:murein L,D-transpeptidase YcbB/YkuD
LLATLDVATTLAMLSWLRDLHSGRVDPRTIHPNLALPAQPFEAPAALRDAIGGDAVRELPDRHAPQLALYRRLKDLHARYRALASGPPLPSLPAIAKVEPGSVYQGMAALAARLVAFGDLASGTKPPVGDLYSADFVAAVKRFQSRHGLEPDGIVGKATLAALAVSPAERATQIELAMERLRWLPAFAPQPLVVVNVPAFRLWAFDLPDDSRPPTLAMKVIVGKALDTETPVFADTLRTIEFSPYWNVPKSIATKEILPRLRRDPDYLAREDMELVRADGTTAQAVTPESLAAIEGGTLRIRQRPGKHNAMGRIKFVLPNHLAIFLHDTSAPQLFTRSRRDFSHGCIRVEKPIELALFALDGEKGWDAARVNEAMNRREPAYAGLPRPITVLVFYTTALVDGEGRAFFYEDLYGHDRALAKALDARHMR